MAHKQDKASMLNQGVFIFVYLAVLTALEFFVAPPSIDRDPGRGGARQSRAGGLLLHAHLQVEQDDDGGEPRLVRVQDRDEPDRICGCS
jgi:hypothetical protein